MGLQVGKDNSSLADEVFGNGLILRKLEKLISYSDLKACRLVRNRFNSCILTETDFVKRSLVRIQRGPIILSIARDFSFPVRHVLLIPDFHGKPNTRSSMEEEMNKDAIDSFYKNMINVETISCLWETRSILTARNDIILVPTLCELILKTDNLKTLVLSKNQVQSMILRESEDERVEFGEKLKNLTDLFIDFSVRYRQEDNRLPSAFHQLPNLKKFHYRLPSTTDEFVFHAAADAIMSVIRNAKETLVDLGVHWINSMTNNCSTYHYSHFCALFFPNLRRLFIKLPRTGSQNIECFIQRHRQTLEIIYVRVHPLRAFVPGIRNRLVNALNQDKGVPTVSIKCDSTSDAIFFLKSLGNIKEVRIKFLNRVAYQYRLSLTQDGGNMDGKALFEQILAKVPVSEAKVVKFLKPRTTHFPVNLEKGILTYVTSLNLGGCISGSIDNSTLQNVFSKMVNITHLRIASTPMTTTHGFLGEDVRSLLTDNVDPTKSIFNLKALQHLELIECGINDIIVLKCGQFERLTYLDISSNPNITAFSVYAALTQNPLLETFIQDSVQDAELLYSIQHVQNIIQVRFVGRPGS